MNLAQVLSDSANMRAFARMIRVGEGTSDEDGYRRIFGGELFNDFSNHPNKTVSKNGYSSTAAGAYQIIIATWHGLQRDYGFTDFTPRTQDLACVALIAGRNALDDVLAGRLEQAIAKCNKEWASLPGAPYGQPMVTMQTCKAAYEKWGGTYAAPKTQESNVAPFIAAVLPSLISAIPELAKKFSDGSSVTDRNIKAAEIAVGIAKEAIGATNEQDLMEKMAKDPQAVNAVRDAVRANWYQLEEVGGGITAAHAANLQVQGERGLVHNPAIWISVILLFMPFMLLSDVFYVHPDEYTGEVRVQIITAVLAVIMVVGGYWLGTSASSARKDDTIANR